MQYRFAVTDLAGRRWTFVGEKTISPKTVVPDPIRPFLQMPFVLYQGAERVGRGMVVLSPMGVLRNLLSLRFPRLAGRRARARALARFAWRFVDAGWQAWAWPFRRAITVDPLDESRQVQPRGLRVLRIDPEKPRLDALAETRQKEHKKAAAKEQQIKLQRSAARPKVVKRGDRVAISKHRYRDQHRVGLPERQPIVLDDGATIVLTRYSRPDADGTPLKGPVLLAPGFGMSTYGFELPTLETNITEYLCERGYDVWLLDYRASDRTQSSVDQWSIDDIAREDFPAAVNYVVKRVTDERKKANGGKEPPPVTVQFIGHCVASVVLLMGLLDGRLPRVRSVVCSQFFLFFDQPLINRIKAAAHLPNILKWSRLTPVLTSDFDSSASPIARLFDRLLNLQSTRERCSNPVCRRNRFMYGEVVNHARLNRATHDAMYDLFDRANLQTFEQIADMVRRGKVSRFTRERFSDEAPPPYLTRDNGQRIRIPVTLLQGMENQLFRPSGGRKTLGWLLRNGGAPDPELFYRLRGVPGYGHVDLFIGKDAWRDVYPVIVEELERCDYLNPPEAAAAAIEAARGSNSTGPSMRNGSGQGSPAGS
jgi:cholesterol oxidase